MTDFIFMVLCRVLYSYMYDDETSSIPHEDVVELEKVLVGVYSTNRGHYLGLLTNSDVHPLIPRFEFFMKDINK